MLKGLLADLASIGLKALGNAAIDSIVGGLFGGGGLGPQFTGTGVLDGLLSSGSFAKGGTFAGGRSIAAFARGGALTNRILRRPTLFSLADGLGLAGEAGPETVLPLARMGSDELGVKAAMTRLPHAPPAARRS